MNGCDCTRCATGEDRWCCRTCHQMAVGYELGYPIDATPDPAGETSESEDG